MAMSPENAARPDADDSEGITVAIRMRPLNSVEDSQGRIWKVLPKYSSVAQTTRDGKPLSERVTGRTFFTFDKTFGEDTNNRQVYDSAAKGIVGSVVQGLNGTIFAYGQTSSGKTYTMQGSGNLEQGSAENSEGGLVHMAAKDIFSQIVNQPNRMFLVRVSFLEIYNEEVRDLLSESNHKVQIREDPRRGVFVQSEEEIVTDFDSLLSILVRGDKSRTFAATGMNERSSRSHTILRITIESREKEQQNENDDDNKLDGISTSDGAVRVSTLNLVDLAGSESVRHTGATGERQKEGGLINQSLLTLSRVIVALGSPNQVHINFRDSKLTRILQPSLSGNARMAVICCATPSELYLEETRSTLQFASRAKLVKTNAQVNEVLDERSMIRRLQRELAVAKRNRTGADDQQVRDLEKQIQTAGTQAMEAKAKLDRLKSSILNAGYLFDQASNDTSSTEVHESIRVSKKRRKSEGPILIGHKTPSKDSKHDVLPPKTAPQQKKTRTLCRPTLPVEKELELVQKALASRNQFVRELNSTVTRYTEKVKEKNNDVERAMAEKSLLKEKNSKVHDEVDKLQQAVSSMQASLETTVKENKKHLMEKEAELDDAFERLQQSLTERNSLGEELSEIRSRFEEVQEERVRGAFELAQVTTEKENLSAERANDKQKLQDMAGKTEFLTSNVNEATKERDAALAEIEQLRQKMEAARKENEVLRKSRDAKIVDLEGQVEGIQLEHRQLSDEKSALAVHLDDSNKEIASLTNQVTMLETSLKDQVDNSDAQRKSMETKLNKAAEEIERLQSEKRATEHLSASLTSQLKDLKDDLQARSTQNELKAEEAIETTKRIDTLLVEQNKLKQITEHLLEEKGLLSEAKNTLSLEKRALVEKATLLEERISSLNAEVATYKSSVSALEQDSQELQQKLMATEAEQKQLEESYRVSSLDSNARIESLQSDLSKLKRELECTQMENEEMLSRLDERQNAHESLEMSHNGLKDAFSQLQTKKIKADNELQSITQRLQLLSDDKDLVIAEKNSMEAVLKNNQQKVADIEESLAAAEAQISRLQKEKDAAFAASSQSLQKIQKYLIDVNTEKVRVAELEKTNTELDTLCEERRCTIESMTTESEALQCNMDSLVTDRDSLKMLVKEMGADLSLLKSEILEKDSMAKELHAANEKIAAQLQTLRNDIEVRDTEIETLTSSHLQSTIETKELVSRHDALQQNVDVLTLEKEGLCKELSSVQVELASSKSKMESMTIELSSINVSSGKTEAIVKSLHCQNEEATSQIIALQDQVDTAQRDIQSHKSRNEKLVNLHKHVEKDLETAQSQLNKTRQELDAALSSRETLVQSLRNCEAQRDEATSEVHELFEKNRQLRESMSSSLSKEKEEQLRSELSETKVQNSELQQLLASVNESKDRLRNKTTGLEEELKAAVKDLKDAKNQVLQLKEELVLVEHGNFNESQTEESQLDLLQRLEELVSEKKELEHKLLEEAESWKTREAEMQKQMGEEQRTLIQEGENLMMELRKKLNECESRLSQAESEAYTARQQVEEISDEQKNHKERFLKASGELSSLQSANSSLKFQITKLNSGLGAANSECYKLKESSIEMKDKMRKSLRESEKAIREKQMATKEMASLQKKLSNLERQVDSDQTEHSRLQKRCQDLENESKHIDRLKDDLNLKDILIDNLKKEVSELKRECASAMKEMKRASVAESSLGRTQVAGKEADSYVVKLEEENQRLREERTQKYERIKKLEKSKLTKEQKEKISQMKTENVELKEQCKSLEREIAGLRSLGKSGETVELRSELSALRMDKECLEKKLRKFAVHCQRLEDDKAGIKDVLRSCNVKVDGQDSNLSDAVIHLCDRLTSAEDIHTKYSASLKQREDSQEKEKEKLSIEKQKLSERLESSRLQIKDLQNCIQGNKVNTQETADLRKRIGDLEQENLQLLQDLKATRKEYKITKMALENIRADNSNNPTIDFALMGAQSSLSNSRSTRSNRSTRSSLVAEQSESFKQPTDTMELTEMAQRFAGNQAPASNCKIASARQQSTKKKRPVLAESTNNLASEGQGEGLTASKRPRRESTRSLGEEKRLKRQTPGLGESSSAGGSATSESPAECNQQ